MKETQDRNDILEQVVQALSVYLKENGYRCTPERLAIIRGVYCIDGMFSPEQLLLEMTEGQHFPVSRATVYNNLGIFEKAGLIEKMWINGKAGYSQSWHKNCSIRLVCTQCGQTGEFQNEKINTAVAEMRKKRFTMTGYSLYIYGLCSRCQTALKRRRKKMTE